MLIGSNFLFERMNLWSHQHHPRCQPGFFPRPQAPHHVPPARLLSGSHAAFLQLRAFFRLSVFPTESVFQPEAFFWLRAFFRLWLRRCKGPVISLSCGWMLDLHPRRVVWKDPGVNHSESEWLDFVGRRIPGLFGSCSQGSLFFLDILSAYLPAPWVMSRPYSCFLFAFFSNAEPALWCRYVCRPWDWLPHFFLAHVATANLIVLGN